MLGSVDNHERIQKPFPWTSIMTLVLRSRRRSFRSQHFDLDIQNSFTRGGGPRPIRTLPVRVSKHLLF